MFLRMCDHVNMARVGHPMHNVGCRLVVMGLQVGNTYCAGDSGFLNKLLFIYNRVIQNHKHINTN